MAHRNPGKADGRSHALRRHDNIVGYLFMLPALLFFCCFIIIPMLTGFVTSLFDYTMKTPVSMETFVGLLQLRRCYSLRPHFTVRCSIRCSSL